MMIAALDIPARPQCKIFEISGFYFPFKLIGPIAWKFRNEAARFLSIENYLTFCFHLRWLERQTGAIDS